MVARLRIVGGMQIFPLGYFYNKSKNIEKSKMMLFAGPCGIENRKQIFKIAKFVKSCGTNLLRAGAYKGQNRPFVNGKPEYVGMGDKGVKLLAEVQEKLDMQVACDMQSVRQAEVLKHYNIAYPQVGARNCDSLELLRQFRKVFKKTDKTIILKRGPSTTIQELLGYAEHLGGANKVILCSRGICSFDRTSVTRWRLDFIGIAYIKRYTDYRVIVDPSHGSGDRNLVYLLTRAGLMIADGVMVEVHYNPKQSPTDANQTINFKQFERLAALYHHIKDLRGGYDKKRLP